MTMTVSHHPYLALTADSLLSLTSPSYISSSASFWPSSTSTLSLSPSAESLEDKAPALPVVSDFGRLAPGASTPHFPRSPSKKGSGDAGATTTGEKSVNRLGETLPSPGAIPMHTVPPFPLSTHPQGEFLSDPSFGLLLQPSYEAPPAYESVQFYPFHHTQVYQNPPSLDASLAFQGVRSAMMLPQLSSRESLPEIPDYVTPVDPAIPRLLPQVTRVTAAANVPRGEEANVLGLHTTPQAITFGLWDGEVTEASPLLPPSNLPIVRPLSERLRRLAPPPLFIPGAESFLSDSGIEIETPTHPSVAHQTTALTLPATAHTPLDQYLLLQAPTRAGSTSMRSLTVPENMMSPSQAIAQGLSELGIGSPRSPPPLERRMPCALPEVTPGIHERLAEQGLPTSMLIEEETLPGYSHVVYSPVAMVQSAAIPGASVPGPASAEMGVRQDVLSPLGLFGHGAYMNDIGGRAARCIHAVEWIAYSLGSCAFIPRDELELLCTALKAILTDICRTIADAPSNIGLLQVEYSAEWENKYRMILASLQRNIDYFYLQADQLGRRPPRIHHVGAIWQKLWNFLRKFESIERDLNVFHDQIRLLEMRAQFRVIKQAAQQELETERARRAIFKAAAAQARAQRKELRAEIRRAHELSRSTLARRRLTHPPRLP